MKQMELNDSSVNVFTRDIILLKNNRDNHLKYFLIKISGHHKIPFIREHGTIFLLRPGIFGFVVSLR